MEVHLIIQSDDQSAYLVLDVDAAPGVLAAAVHGAGLLVGDDDVGPHHREGEPLPHPVVLGLQLGHGEVVDLDLVAFQLQQDLQREKSEIEKYFYYSDHLNKN